MGRGQKSKQNLLADSRLSKIRYFNPKIVSWDFSGDKPAAQFKPIKYYDFSKGIMPKTERLIRNFPLILRDSGEPWDLGNLYLQRYFYEKAKTSEPTIDTIQSKAKHLTGYLRWIESMQMKGHDIHELHFPEDPDDRVTYVYKRYLQNLLRKTPQVIKLSTAKERMSQVIQFYRGITDWGIVEAGAMNNKPFQEFAVGIHYINKKGFKAVLSSVTTNLSFNVRTTSDDESVINDGERLLPLSVNDQQIMLGELEKYDNRVFQLMVQVALRTGARLQSVCTLRISDLKVLKKKKPNKYGELILKIGSGFLTDIKGENNFNKQGSMFFPTDLVDELLDYASSNHASNLREESFYGDTDDNYVFLNAEGRPFYTSHRELSDRANPEYSERIHLRDRVDFPIANGQAVNNLMRRSKKAIHANNPDFPPFKFHDLRATYGMNFIRDWINAGKNVNVGVGELKTRLSHNSVHTTYQYLNYASEVEGITKLEDAHYDILNGKSPS
jgi:integrase